MFRPVPFGRCSDLCPEGGGGVDVQTWSRGGGRCSDLVPGGVDVQTSARGGGGGKGRC